MNKLLKYLILPCLGAVFCASCLNEGQKPCESYIRFEYDYNMSFVDLFYKQASRVDLFMFDGDDKYKGVISATSVNATFDKDFRLTLPEGLGSDTKFIAWSGLYPASFTHTSLTEGVSTVSDLVVALNAAAGAESDKSLHPLWFGTLAGGLIRYENEVNTINMVKNTNNIRIVMQAQSGETLDIDVEKFAFTFTAKNNAYDFQNKVADNVERTYVPFEAYNDDELDAAVVEFSILRLLTENDNRLKIMRDGQTAPVIDIDLTNYINALKLSEYKSMPLQEFMDREDAYKVIIFLSRNPDNGSFISTKIDVNPWIERGQDA